MTDYDFPVMNSSLAKQGCFALASADEASNPTSYYTLWLLLPSIVAVLYAMMWEIIDNEVKRIEPFYQVSSQANGAKAAMTIFGQYISLPCFFSPFQALHWRQWTVVLSSSIYVLVGVVTPVLQTQMFQVQLHAIQVLYLDSDSGKWLPITKGKSGPRPMEEDMMFTGKFQESSPSFDSTGLYSTRPTDEALTRITVFLDPTVTRAQEAVLLTVAIFGALLVWKLWRRPSGLPCSLKGLGVIASLASADPRFLEGLSRSFENDSDGTLRLSQRYEDFNLQLSWKVAVDGPVYGFSWINLPDASRLPTRPKDKIKAGKGQLGRVVVIRRAALLAIKLIPMVLVLTVYLGSGESEEDWAAAPGKTDKQVAAENTILSVWVLVISALGKSVWKVVEHEASAVTPFRMLLLTPRSAWPVLARDYASLPPVMNSIIALWDRQYLLGVITIASLLLEGSLICLGALASMSQGREYIPDHFRRTLLTAFFLTCAAVLLIFCAGVTIYRVWPDFQSDVSALGVQLSYCCHSQQLLNDMKPLAGLKTPKEREKYLRQLGAVYRLGLVPMISESVSTDTSNSTRHTEGIERDDRVQTFKNLSGSRSWVKAAATLGLCDVTTDHPIYRRS